MRELFLALDRAGEPSCGTTTDTDGDRIDARRRHGKLLAHRHRRGRRRQPDRDALEAGALCPRRRVDLRRRSGPRPRVGELRVPRRRSRRLVHVAVN
ncbi:MAG: hypothetical protein R2862_13105 [Thermoanaerobaculia bacterium]